MTTASALLLLLVVASPAARGQTPPVETIDIQKECPVMAGNKIDPNLFTVYQGKKVYFCCASCKDSFNAQPEKYLPRLPQFASIVPIVAVQATSPMPSAPKESNQSAAKALIVPLGIAAFITIVATVLTGLYRKLRPRLMFRLHRILGITALIIAACHGAIVILLV